MNLTIGYPDHFQLVLDAAFARMFPGARFTVPIIQPGHVWRTLEFKTKREARQARGRVMTVYQQLETVGALLI